MNGEWLKYAHWIIIAVVVIVALFAAPHIIGDVFGAITGVFKAIFQSADEVKKGLQDSPLLNPGSTTITSNTTITEIP
jgi:Sec-independent protein translocase protein TatA